jgi:hypothetical protein
MLGSPESLDVALIVPSESKKYDPLVLTVIAVTSMPSGTSGSRGTEESVPMEATVPSLRSTTPDQD